MKLHVIKGLTVGQEVFIEVLTCDHIPGPGEDFSVGMIGGTVLSVEESKEPGLEFVEIEVHQPGN